METYHKINGIFKRYTEGPNKGKFIMGEWATPELRYLHENMWEFTEKVDGTNIRINIKFMAAKVDGLNVEYGGRTDRAVIPDDLVEYLEATFPTFPAWRRLLSNPSYTARHNQIWDWMKRKGLENITLYGEGYGPKIQKGGGNYRKDVSFVLFDVKVGDFWLDRDSVNDIADNLGIDAVPTLGYGTIEDAICLVEGGLESTWGPFEAEGIVARPVVPLFTRQGHRVITKIKGVDFK